MDQILEAIKDLFGTDDPEKVAEKKSSEKQTRAAPNAKKPSVIEMTEDECRKMCGKVGLEYLPGYNGRVLAYEITNEEVDRYGDIVRVSGLDVSNYMKNPVVMWSHNHGNPPIGKTLKVDILKAEKRAVAWGLFFDDRTYTDGFAEMIYKLARSGAMPACSIGFMPKETYHPASEQDREKMGLGKYGAEFKRSELLEWSPCSIPANPTALQLNDLTGAIEQSPAMFTARDFDLMTRTNLVTSADMRKAIERVFKSVFVDSTPETPAAPVVEVKAPEAPAVQPVNVNVNLSGIDEIITEIRRLASVVDQVNTQVRTMKFPEATPPQTADGGDVGPGIMSAVRKAFGQ